MTAAGGPTTDASCRVLLVGMMASGKSTVGERLATATGWTYVDNDELVRRTTRTTARDLLRRLGEKPMRLAEADALRAGLRLPSPVIVGVAAGTILDPELRDALEASGTVVWLHADPATLADRASGADHRPWLDGDGEAWMREALEERGPLYRSVADVVVRTDGGDPDASVQELRSWLERRGCL